MSEPRRVTAAGGVLFRLIDKRIDVLLIQRNGFWDIPKGHHEPNESLPQCAVREVAEETGGTLPILLSSLGTTWHTYELKGEWIGKTTWWYSMIFPRDQQLQPQLAEGITMLEWVPLEQAGERVHYENLREILSRFEDWFYRKA